jgi:hypothetical protein
MQISSQEFGHEVTVSEINRKKIDVLVKRAHMSSSGEIKMSLKLMTFERSALASCCV